MGCDFCDDSLSERIVAENDLAFAFPTNRPIVPGHLLVCPKRCVSSIHEMSKKEYHKVMDLVLELRDVLNEWNNSEGFNYAWNEGDAGGQSVPHFHLHVLPRKEGDSGITQYDPRKFLYRPGDRSKSPKEELLEVAEEIRELMK